MGLVGDRGRSGGRRSPSGDLEVGAPVSLLETERGGRGIGRKFGGLGGDVEVGGFNRVSERVVFSHRFSENFDKKQCIH